MHLSLYSFKSFTDTKLDLVESLQVVVGNNGSGKSTLCEALSILVNASNPHHTSWEEKPSFWKNEWALRCQVGEVLFQSIYDGQNRAPKWFINDHAGSKPKYEDKMPYRAFWIQSDHLRVISGEPSERRNFLDDMLIFASPTYSRIQKNYRTALVSRNRVIQSILDKEAFKSDLSSWNTMLAEYAVQVILERRKFFQWLGSPSFQPSEVRTRGGIQANNLSHSFLHLPGPVKIELMERHPLEVVDQDHFLKLLQDYTERDLVVGRTTIGPHLDEISFSVNINWWFEAVKNEQNKERVFETKEFTNVNDWDEKKNWRSSAKVFTASGWQPTKYILSRGENKILLLAFIRLLGKYVEEISGKKPFFLLDDVLSELDTDHTRILCDLYGNTTTIMTTQPNHTAGLPADIVKISL